MQATEILFSLGGRLVHVMCLFICIVIMIIIVIHFYFYFFCIKYYIHAVQRAIDGKTSAWLTVMPIACNHFDLSSVEFRDALSLRYHRPLLKTPGHCDGCGRIQLPTCS